MMFTFSISDFSSLCSQDSFLCSLPWIAFKQKLFKKWSGMCNQEKNTDLAEHLPEILTNIFSVC